MIDKLPDHYNKIGNRYFKKEQRKKAFHFFQKALRLNPNYYPAYNNIGLLLNDIGDFTNAMAYLEQALEFKPYDINHLYNMAFAFENMGNIQQALHYLEKIIRYYPNFHKAYSALFLDLNYTFTDPKIIYDVHVKWGKQVESMLTPIKHNNENLDLDRIIRVGYISPDFYRHSVSFFFESILSHHATEKIYTVCYSDCPNNDDYTKRLRICANQWHDCRHMDDETLISLIQKDRIDILVDLAGHTVNNRLMVFARKSAPIQVTYLGYVNTTGLTRMDYRIVDHWTDPFNNENPHTEKLVRMPDSFVCYRPPDNSPAVVNAPLLKNGYVTFGSFNEIKKMNDSTIVLWSAIMTEVPLSRLYIKCKAFKDESTKEIFFKKFQKHGIKRDRLIFEGFTHSFTDHLLQYHLIDIGLDTFPYNGTTTTCEALWMGVPIITIKGRNHAGRVGSSLLHSIGLDEFIALNDQEYAIKAISVAQNEKLIVQLRRNLRSMIMNSCLCDATSFTRSLEYAYREMWKYYCCSH